jgi:SulP family sulfate permease
MASVAAGFLGGMPATGATAPTVVNICSGGGTRLAAITHALVLLAVA